MIVEEESLSTDIQEALQHAVVKANNAFTNSSDSNKKKKKKKRGHTDNGATDGERGKKRRKNTQEILDSEDIEHQPVDVQNGTLDPATVPTKKKRGKGKAKQTGGGSTAVQDQTTNEFSQIDPQLVSSANTSSQASTAAFLSAIVAAACATNTDAPSMAQAQASQSSSNYPFEAQPIPYMPYPGLQFSPNPQFGTIPAHVQNPLSMPNGLDLAELDFGSNEDILRALHDLDITKIANVLKTLSEAAAAANVPLAPQPGIMPAPAPHRQEPPSTAIRPMPVASESIIARRKEPKPSEKRTLDMSLPGPEQHANPEHAQWLATKWMNANKLAELVRTQGLVYKKGKFSAIEDQQLNNAIENYRVLKQLGPEQMEDLIFSRNDKVKDNAFWSEITTAVPLRPIIAVYHHVRRTYHPLKQKGKWTKEEDGKLRMAVAEFGQQWEKVSFRVGRMSSDCRDRYRNHIADREVRITGHWTKEEEDELTQIVTEMTIQQGRDIDNDVFWGKVSERMGNTRGRQQCRIKWTDSLSKTVKNEGQKPRWSQQDAYILVHKVDSMNVRDDTEIDWKTLSDPNWNLWSAHSLQRRWLTMKRSVKGYENMTHQEIMDILRVKKAQLPAPQASGRKRRVTSSVAVVDSDNGPDTAGPSNADDDDAGSS